MTALTKQILVAGIGNAFLQDDGFGGEVVRRLRLREMPAGVTLGDFGTGGLDLAYEVMRGYDALVLVDVSRQGGEPGTLYVMEARGGHRRRHRGRRDGRPARHGPRDGAAVRARRGRWPGKVMVIACEPAERRGAGHGPDARGGRDRRPGRRPGRRDGRRAAVRRGLRELRRGVHELSLAGAVIDTATRHADGRRVTPCTCASGTCGRWCPTRCSSTSGTSPRARRARARGWRRGGARAAVLQRLRRRVGARGRVPLPACGGADVEVVAGEEFEVEWINVEQLEEQCTA